MDEVYTPQNGEEFVMFEFLLISPIFEDPHIIHHSLLDKSHVAIIISMFNTQEDTYKIFHDVSWTLYTTVFRKTNLRMKSHLLSY